MAEAVVEPDKKDSRTKPPRARQAGATTIDTPYVVAAVESATATPPAAAPSAKAAVAGKKKVAVFIAHGMGQQIPFQTLDQVAEGLREQDRLHGERGTRTDVRTVRFMGQEGEQWLHRLELHLRGGSEEPVEAHLYEGYWAPLTEGGITARGVIGFLRGAGMNGIKNGSREFKRWLFGKFWRFDSPIRIVLYLLIALATVASLVAMNSTIAVVAAGRALLEETPFWLTNGLFQDLTTTFNAVVTAMAVFGASLGISVGLRRLKVPAVARQAWGWLTVALFTAVLFVIVLAGVALPLLFYGHVKGQAATGAASRQLWHHLFAPEAIKAFNAGFDLGAFWLALGLGALLLGWWLLKIAWGVGRDFFHSPGRWLTLLVTICTAGLGGLVVWLALSFQGAFGAPKQGAAGVMQQGLAWPLLLIASAFIRRVLVQYVGDVAIYVAPYKLDEFFQLRERIRDCVHKVAYAVYAQQRADGSGPEYDQVYVVGHSLGSVIVYDALNQLINADEANRGTPGFLDVVGRTPLLLTFGSPLDKTAFLFGIQAQETEAAREALAASVQPLIRGYQFRPQSWINIHSPWDIISGDLGFYDPPGSDDRKRVLNEKDPDATTLLAAHVEYWKNPLIFKKIYDAM